jgi:hypothetical protein
VRLGEKARAVWALYRAQIIAVVDGSVLILLDWTGHDLIGSALLVGSLYALLAYSYLHTRKAAKPLRGGLRRRQTSAARVAMASLLVVTIATSVGQIVARTGVSLGPLGYALLSLLGLTPLIAFVLGEKLAARRLHTRNLILWLRRFHGEPIRGISFPIILGLACSGLAVPITLQDDQYAYSFEAGRYRSLRFFDIVAPLIAFTIVLMSFTFLVEAFYAVNPVIPVLIALPFIGVAWIVWLVRRQRSLGVLAVESTNVDGHIRALLGILREDPRRVPGIAGLVVIKVPDECWREAVLATLESCALVIIDVTELSDSLKWELSASVNALPTHSIILACGIGQMDDENERRRSIQQAITEVVGPKLAATLEVFFYPEVLGKSRLFVPRTAFGHTLQAILQDRLLESSSHLPR